MGKASRIKAQRDGKFEHEPKRPTGTYATKKEQQQSRRRQRAMVDDVTSLVTRMATATRDEALKGGRS